MLKIVLKMNRIPKELCRACLSGERGLLPLSASFELNVTVADYFRTYLNYEFKTVKELPEIICLKCLDTLLMIKQFYTQCKESEEYLERKLRIKTNQSAKNRYKKCSIKECNEQREKIPKSVESAFASEKDFEADEYIQFPQRSESIDEIYLEDETSKETLIDYKCLECDERFDTVDTLNEHKTLFHNSSNEYQIDTETTKTFLNDHDEHSEFHCSECGKNFEYKDVYDDHMARHQYYSLSSKCPRCEKTFGCKNNLRKHFKKIHLAHRSIPKKTYDCKHCEKKFLRKESYEIHQRTHTGERPFKCTYCGQEFIKKNYLTNHLTLHTGKAAKCPICGKCFTQKAFLKVHLRFHNNERPYICDQCPKKFFQMTHLRTHQLSHTGEYPFSCEICGKSYTNNYALQQHMFSHGKPKPFKCPLCLKEFTRQFKYRKHMADVHNIEEEITYEKVIEENSQEESEYHNQSDEEIYSIIEEYEDEVSIIEGTSKEDVKNV